MPRAKCLALEVIIRVKRLAANGQDGQLHIAWAPHKMQFEGFDMSSSAPVSNGDTDFMLAGSVDQVQNLTAFDTLSTHVHCLYPIRII